MVRGVNEAGLYALATLNKAYIKQIRVRQFYMYPDLYTTVFICSRCGGGEGWRGERGEGGRFICIQPCIRTGQMKRVARHTSRTDRPHSHSLRGEVQCSPIIHIIRAR
jgi:hypothetical protein